jgi:hypothetical protein
MKKTFLYVDGFNLYYSAVRKTPLRWLNPVKLAGLVFPKNANVISGDSDLVTPIRMVRDQLGLPIGVLNPQRLSGALTPPSRKNAGLKDAATFYKNGVTWSQLQLAQFPQKLSDLKGPFHCPLDWQ